MTWLRTLGQEELDHWLRRTDVPLLASLPEGQILWCNRAFEVLTGYTVSELHNMTWRDLTDDADDLTADIEMAYQVQRGERESYQLQKRYRTKHGPSKRVMIHVLRNPYSGAFKCYFVSVIPLDAGYETALNEIQQVRGMMLELMAKLSEDKTLWTKYMEHWKKYPIPVTIATIVTLVFLLGDRLLEIIKDVMSFIPQGGP